MRQIKKPDVLECMALLGSVLCAWFTAAGFVGTARAQLPTSQPDAQHLAEHPAGVLEDWLNPWRGFKKEMEELRLTPSLGLTFITQNSIGGVDRNGAVRQTLSADYGFRITLLGDDSPGSSADYGRIGFLSETRLGNGLSSVKVGSLLGVNDDPGSGGFSENQTLAVTELWWEQTFFERRLTLTIGKMHANSYIETNAFANDQTQFFMGSGLVFNPTLPLPQDGLALRLKYAPYDWFDTQLYLHDAEADIRETGLNTAFHGRSDFFGAFEAALRPKFGGRRGNYRFLLWYDPRPKARWRSDPSLIPVFNFAGPRPPLINWSRGQTPNFQRGDMGFTLSFDQELTDRLGVFFRYGLAAEAVSTFRHFWSLGGQLEGLIPGRQADLVGIGVAQGIISREARKYGGFSDQETVFECYYRIQLTSWLHVTPDIQVVLNPGANRGAHPAVVFGVRAQMNF